MAPEAPGPAALSPVRWRLPLAAVRDAHARINEIPTILGPRAQAPGPGVKKSSRTFQTLNFLEVLKKLKVSDNFLSLCQADELNTRQRYSSRL